MSIASPRTFALLTPDTARRLGLLSGDSLRDHRVAPAMLLRLSFARIEDHEEAPDCLATTAPQVCELHGHARAVAAQVTPDEAGEIGDLTYWVDAPAKPELETIHPWTGRGLPIPRSMLALDTERDADIARAAKTAAGIAERNAHENAKRAAQGLPPLVPRKTGRPKKAGPDGSSAPLAATLGVA